MSQKGGWSVENESEVCFEETVERLWLSGKSSAEISREMGVDPGWVEALISTWEGPTRRFDGPDDRPDQSS